MEPEISPTYKGYNPTPVFLPTTSYKQIYDDV